MPNILKDPAFQAYTNTRRDHWDRVARLYRDRAGWGDAYHRRLREVYAFLVSPGQRVLELGCSEGDLLAALKPGVGVGVDYSEEALGSARRRHPELRFVLADAHDFAWDEPFDVVILSDLLNDVWDVQSVLDNLARATQPHTRIIVNYYSHLWEGPLTLAQKLGLARPVLRQNWLTPQDVDNLLYLSGFEVICHWQEVLPPLRIPLLRAISNQFLVKLWPFSQLALTNFMVARQTPAARPPQREMPLVSVVIPARNEEGNIPHIFGRVPEMGRGTELIFVEGHSRDDTSAAIARGIATHPERACKLLQQTGTGKGDAVRMGFEHASGDILMILDADLTVAPEDLPRFYEAIWSGKGEFVNGVRLVYPMEDEAMRFLNLVGNRFFSVVFSWLLGQPIRDTLCGTKVLWKADYDRIAANRSYFGDFDPFGDFDLLLGATKQNLKIVETPIRYRSREYGTTNISRWKHGVLLLQMVLFALRRIKFV